MSCGGSTRSASRFDSARRTSGRQWISRAALSRQVVLIQYWGTVDDRCKEDMDALKELYAKYGGRGGFEIIGVCLDEDRRRCRIPGQNTTLAQIQEPGGFDGKLANELGVMTLPMMILVDQKGTVVGNNIFPANLEAN